MKKVLIVLGFAMCTTLAMAQTSKVVRQHDLPKKADFALQAENAAPVDYKASIFTKTPGDVLATVTFSSDADFTVGVVAATDQIDGAAVGATVAHNRTEPIFRWRRIADTNAIYSDDFYATYQMLCSLYVSQETMAAYMGAENDVVGNDGFMMLDVTELDEDNTAINTYFALTTAVATTGEQMIDVKWRQYYRKYYDVCYIDYNSGNGWKSFEVNVTGVDCEVTGMAPAFMVASLPLDAANQSNLQIRFRLYSEGDVPYGYAWLIDDVQIAATPLDRWTFSNMGYLNGFYGMQPEGFSVPLAFAMYGRNTGINPKNNVTLEGAHAYNGVWDANNFISRPQTNMAGLDPLTRYKMILDESGYMMPDTAFDENTYYEHAIPDYYSYYGVANLPSSYGKVGLPTTGLGMHQYSLQVRSGSNVYELDTMAYTVSENMEIGAQDSAMGRTVPGYRWGADNGLIPSGSEFAYQFTSGLRPGYVTAGGRNTETHHYANGYMVTMRYNTPAVIPTTAGGDPWRIRGIEYVTSTKLTADEVEGSLIEPYAIIYRFAGETFPGTDEQASDTGFYYIGTGVDGDMFEVGRESAPEEPVLGALLPDQPYYAFDVLFPEQPVLEPNHMYRFGYTNLSDGTRFAVARTSYTYSLNDSTNARYTYNEEYAPYYNQVSPANKPYDAHAYDPLQGSRGNGTQSIWGYNIDYYPMIRVIVGPKMVIPNFGVYGECSGEDDTLYTIYRNQALWCGVADSAAKGSSPNYLILPGAWAEQEQMDDYQNYVCGEGWDIFPHRVITDILLDGTSIFNDPDMVEAVPYNFYWEGHTPNDAPEDQWAPALTRNYYSVTIRNISDNHRLGAVTAWRALGIADVEDNVNMTLAPNPANTMVRVNINGFSGKANCSIIDMSGRVVLSTEITDGDNTVSLNGIPAGAYFVRVTNAAFSKVEKLIVR
ncbi:MAG: T9SS type A sorting domain-containing protein [Bacteroidales bacterium]|nr:T9SS type A sorting domain-containing protein [Bacteroidales bacterium]